MSTTTPSSSIWSSTLKNYQFAKNIDNSNILATNASNYFAAIDDANNLVLIDVLTRNPFLSP